MAEYRLRLALRLIDACHRTKQIREQENNNNNKLLNVGKMIKDLSSTRSLCQNQVRGMWDWTALESLKLS